MRKLRCRSIAQGVSAVLVLACLASACGEPNDARRSHELASHALLTYADIAHATYADAAFEAERLLERVRTLVREPSALSLEAAREQWERARTPYRQSEVYRFYEGPIDGLELWINTWPIDESYVEAGAGGLGIIENRTAYPELSSALLTRLNAQDGETSISTGYHVIEYLLWGRDTSLDSAGTRTHHDFVADGERTADEADAPASSLALRRARYLELSTELLVQHLQQVTRAWAPGERDNYRANFLRLPTRDALGLAVRGMGSLSGPELSGERLTVAYETRDQENEHSCFSDTTHEDIVGNVLGIENVCLGRYVRTDGQVVRGTGLCTLFDQDSGLGASLRTHIAASLKAARAIPAPFDRALVAADDTPSRTAIARTIAALSQQTELLERVANELSLGVTRTTLVAR